MAAIESHQAVSTNFFRNKLIHLCTSLDKLKTRRARSGGLPLESKNYKPDRLRRRRLPFSPDHGRNLLMKMDQPMARRWNSTNGRQFNIEVVTKRIRKNVYRDGDEIRMANRVIPLLRRSNLFWRPLLQFWLLPRNLRPNLMKARCNLPEGRTVVTHCHFPRRFSKASHQLTYFPVQSVIC